MRALPLTRYSLLLVLVASAALARNADEKITIRTLQVSDHPGQEAQDIYVAGKVATVLRFEQDVDPEKTKLLAWEGRFEPLLVGSKKVVLEPLKDLPEGEALPLLVTLKDGTEFAFLVKRPSREKWGAIDYQVNVFKDTRSYDAVLSSLYSSLERESKLKEENERLKQEENSVDHAYATLLAHGDVAQTPFIKKRTYRTSNEDMDMAVDLFRGPGKVGVVIQLTNTYYGGDWKLQGATLTADRSRRIARPFALRMDRAVIVPGQSGQIAIVADKSAFETPEGTIDTLTLEIVRSDGMAQVLVSVDRALTEK